MITDHGVRTLLEQKMIKADNLAAAGNYEMAINMYKHILDIAINFEDDGLIERAKSRISSCEMERSFDL